MISSWALNSIAYFLKVCFPHFLFFLAGFLIISNNLEAGNDGFVFGPRALGTGSSGLLHADYWSIHNNVGALGWVEKTGASVCFENRYNLQAFNQMAFGSALVTQKIGTFGFGASRFGSDLFNQTRASLGWGKAFGLASVGLEGQWYQVSASEFPSRNYFLLNFGGLAKLTPKIHFGASISNILQTKASEFQDERIPTIARAGISFLPNSKVKLLAEVQKDLDLKAIYKVGIEYELVEKLWLRTGFSSQIQQASGGLGFEWRNLVLDYAIASHPQLGWTNSIGISIKLKKAKAETAIRDK